MCSRAEYYRLCEQFRNQFAEKKTAVEELTLQDTAKMRQLLQLRNQILDYEKKIEKTTNDETKKMQQNINDMKTSGNAKLQDGQVKVSELNENMMAMEDILKKKAMYEFKLMEWRDACRVLQENITQAKYDNQIELARKREELEADYEAQLNKLTANAIQDAHLSKYTSRPQSDQTWQPVLVL